MSEEEKMKTLECLGEGGKGKTLKELAEETNINILRAAYITRDLLRQGFVQGFSGKLYITEKGLAELEKKKVEAAETIKLIPVKEEERVKPPVKEEVEGESIRVKALIPIEKVTGKIKVKLV